MRFRLILALGFGYVAHALLKYWQVWMGLLLAAALLGAADFIDLWLP